MKGKFKSNKIYLFLGALLTIVICTFLIKTPPTTTWTMIDVNQTSLQGDAHLLIFPDHKIFLIDAGNINQSPLPYLMQHNIHKIDSLIITHPHKDHYGGIRDLLKTNIQINTVYFNPSIQEICDPEKPWGCDLADVNEVIALLKNAGISVKPAKMEDILYSQPPITLEVLYAYDGIHSPVGKTDINDTSLILKLTHGKIRALFTGDLNHKLGQYLASNAKNIRAEILKVPHHGTESAAPNEFFDRVHTEAA